MSTFRNEDTLYPASLAAGSTPKMSYSVPLAKFLSRRPESHQLPQWNISIDSFFGYREDSSSYLGPVWAPSLLLLLQIRFYL